MMMDIFKRIKAFYPSLTDEDFIPIGENGTIMLVDEKDGNGPYIANSSKTNRTATKRRNVR